MSKFKEFLIQDVLQWQPQKEIDPLKIPLLSENNSIKYPFYGQATINNGIISFLSLTEKVLNNKEGKPTILVHSNNQNVVYLENPFYLKDGHGATSVLQSENLNEKNALYIITCIKKVISKKFSYNEKATKIALKNTYISLPVDNCGNIDYKYMENYISELEEERISELTAYLKVSGLEDYHLTISEKNTLEQFKAKNINFSKYKIDDLFDIHPTKSYGLTNNKLFATKGQTPVVVNSSVNNGIGGYVNLPATEKGNMITFSDTTTDSAIFYQPNDFIGYSHVQGLYPKHNLVWSEKALLYFLTLFKKCAKGRFDYATKFNRTIAAQMEVELPIKNGKIDFEFMENFINIQHKLAIKSVVDWRDREIQTTKQII